MEDFFSLQIKSVTNFWCKTCLGLLNIPVYATLKKSYSEMFYSKVRIGINAIMVCI